ncbi:MAG: hypothetical protein WBK77_02735 [Alphaproteobacteria bacterium]
MTLNRFFLIGTVFCLSSCAYLIDKQIQDVTIVTPGAEDAVCYVYVEGLRYRVHPPQTVNVSKSYQDMTVDCLAPGNRRRKVVIEPALSKHEYMNVANGVVPGATWDLASNSMFTYPEVIEVDFTGAASSMEPMPAHNNPDIRQPEEYLLEEFSPGVPRLNSDRYETAQPIQRIQKKMPKAKSYTEGGISESAAPVSDKGDLKAVVDGLTTSSKPISKAKVAPMTSAPEAAGPPAPLIPPGR